MAQLRFDFCDVTGGDDENCLVLSGVEESDRHSLEQGQRRLGGGAPP